jgi:aminoglycoside 3-N-acetyltransferase
MAKVSSDSISVQLRDIGVKSGDVVFLSADLMRVGLFVKDRTSTLNAWVEILMDLVGSNGTIVIPAYTNSFIRYKKDMSCMFHKRAESTSGALSRAFLDHPKITRSSHPTNSCLAIGPHADFILKGHDEHSLSYLPYQRIIELNGKHLVLGCLSDYTLAPMTVHAAQEYLGLTRKNWQYGLMQTYYRDEQGAIRIFTRKDYGGCTSFGFKAIGHHIVNNAISIGTIGRGLSAYIDCKKSFQIFVDLYKSDPFMLKCEDPKCPDCWGSPILMHPYFWSRATISLIRTKLFSARKTSN